MHTLDNIFPNGPYTIPDVTPDAEQAFYVHNVAKDLERLTPGELDRVVADLKPETIKRLYASIVDHRP